MTLTEQIIVLMAIISYGTLIGIIFDGYRVIVGKNRLPKAIIYFIDILFGVASAWYLFQILLWVNYGQIRIIMLVIFFTSLILYYGLLSKYVLKIWIKVYNIFSKLFKGIIKTVNTILIRPIVGIFSFIVHILKNIFLFIYNIFYSIIKTVFKKSKDRKKNN